MSAESLPADRLIGEVLANRYQILHRLGEGAMGAVYKARHVKVGRSFAVKVLHTRVLEDPKVVQRFEREAELAGRLRHANVVGVVDVGEIDGMRYMVMDFAEGPDLAQLLNEAPMPPARIIHLVRQLLEGLYHAHEQGMIHRDFKPENVIIERDSHDAELPRIVDFGIAILRDGGAGADQQGRLTTNGLVLGTPHYMAPEQAVADPIDHRIDLFALGIVVYEMLSGRLPYDGSGAEVARANLLLDPPPIIQRVPYLEVDPLLEAFARRLMAKKRDARPATAKAARELLDLIDRDRPAAAAALGLPAAMSDRAPARTQPVNPQDQDSSTGTAGGPPAALSSQSATASMRSPGVAGPVNREGPLEPAPFSAPRAAVDPHAPIEPRDFETSRRVPLGWQSVPAPRRRAPWLAGGVAVGLAGVVVAVTLARTTVTHDPPEERVATTPVGPETPPGPSAAADIPAPPRGDEVAAANAAAVPAAVDPPSAPEPATTGEARAGEAPDRTAAGRGSESDASPARAVAAPTGTAGTAGTAGIRDTRDAVPRGRKAGEPPRGSVTAKPATGARPARATATDARAATANSRDGNARTDETAAGRKSSEPGPIAGGGAARPLDTRPGDSRPGDTKTAGPQTGDAKTGDAKTGDAKTAGAKTGDAKTGDAKTGDAKTGDVKTGEASPGNARAADPKAAAKPLRVTGLTANELSNLYATVGRELSALPSASAQDLWSRLLLIKIQELMAAPQERRDEAGKQLLLIHQEAILRKP